MTTDLETAMPLLLGFYELVDEFKQDELRQLQYIFDLNRYTIAEVMGKMPLSCERFLKRCILEGKLQNCSDLFKPIITSQGYCCAFNSKYYFNGNSIEIDRDFKNRTVNAFGLQSALTVVSDYEPDDAIPGTLLNVGSVRIMLTDWTEYPVDYETFLIDTQGEAFLFLRATYTYCSDEVRILPLWSRQCYFEHEHRLPFFKDYHNSDCDHMCYILAVRKSCDCWLFFLPFIKAEHVCKATHIPCINVVKKIMNTWLITEQCQCPRDCVSRKYRADLTVGNFRAIPYMIESQNPYIGLKLNASTSIMNFLFSNPTYVKQKQETVTSIISLVSNVGGVFGLFMGWSCLNVLEFLFYIYKGTGTYIGHRLYK